MRTNQPIVCPKCGRADAVRKVSAIVAEGMRTSETAGLGLGLGHHSLELMPFVGTSTSRSALAVRLAPPAKPGKPLGYRWTAAFMVGRLAMVLFVGVLLVATALVSLPLLSEMYSQNRTLLLIPIAAIVLFVASAAWWLIRSIIHDTHSTRFARGSYNDRMQAWRRAIDRWSNLYYCARDDGVFLPSQQLID